MMEGERMHLQKKLFTKWMNSSLKKASMEVEDLFTDLADGKKLLKLLEILSGEKLGKPNNGIMRVHKLENVENSLAFLRTKVHLESIGAADIVDGNPRLILGLIWTIILYFGIQEIETDVNEDNENSEKKSAKDALLLWCQRNTQGYPNVHITDFTSSWRSGLGFNALIHSHRPDLIQWQNLTPSKHLDNLNHAFDVANDELGIPRLLDAEDVDTSRPDEKSIITYVASYYHTFARMKSGRRIDNLVQDIERAWISLEKEEHEREIALRRQEPLAELNYKFEQESVLREGHLKEMIPVLSDPGYGSNLSQVDATVKKHEAISSDTMARTLNTHSSGNMASSSSQQAEKIEIVNTELVKNATFDTSANMATSAGSKKVDTNISGSYIEHFNQHNHLAPSTSSTEAPRGNPINNVELAVDTFIGRETELSDIKKLFQVYPVVVIAAMGGMGKTQLARKFAAVNADVYRDRYWINAETTEQLLKSFDRLAEKVKVKANTDIDTVRDTYRSFTEGAALLILDNVEHVNNVYEYLPTRIQLEDITLHVLVTSRWTEWTSDPLVNCYQLQPLDISVSLQLFRRKFSQTCIETLQDEWEQLARVLGYLPLALQVATSYIDKRTKHNPDLAAVLADYMKQLKEGAGGLLTDPLIEYGNRSVYASMMLTLKQLEKKSDNVQWKFAVTLINLVAYVDPDYIEKSRLLKLVDDPENICRLDEALAILTEYSLINQGVGRKENTIYSMHRIVQSCIRHNQTLMGTADTYYVWVLKYAFAEDYFYKDELRYVDERASAVADYYKNNPSPAILIYLAKNNAIAAMEAVLKLLSKNQAQIEIKEHDLLHGALGNGDFNMARLLCKYGADINQMFGHGQWAEPPLHDVLQRKNLEIATWLLENGATPALRDGEGRNALHVAIIWAMHKMVPIIIQKDAAVVNETDNYGRTPLLVIDYYHNEKEILSTIHVLVDSGADIMAVDKNGNTVLHSVTRSACAAAVSLILRRNNDLINIVNKNGETALHVLPYYDDIDNTYIDDKRIVSTIRVLFQSGADVSKADTLHVAARGACAAAVTLILQRNKDLIDMKNEDGKTALHVLGNNFNKYTSKEIFAAVRKTARVLIVNGLSLDTRDNRGCTPLDTVEPKFRDILRQVSDECNNRVRPVKR